MIDRDQFDNAWRHMLTRFGKQYDARQAAAYYGFLSESLDTEGFLRAARALYVGARFLPSPAEFLTIQVGEEWAVLLSALENHFGPEWKSSEFFKELSPRAKDAVRRLGGLAGMKLIHDKDLLRCKTAFEGAYQQAAVGSALESRFVLPPAAPASPALAGASRSRPVRATGGA